MSIDDTATSAGTDPTGGPFADPVVVVTGANGLVGSRVCAALVDRGAQVRALVRREGTAPVLRGVEEVVGDFTDAATASAVLDGAHAAVTTVHPMASDLAAQHAVGVEGTATFARAAAEAGVAVLVHVSTAAVYDRSPGVGDVSEDSALVGDDAGDYPVTKRDAEAAIGEVEGLTRVLLRPPAILGVGESSVWNTLRPAAMRDDADARRAVPDQSFPWVHVLDLAALAADVATGRIAPAPDGDPAAGPVRGGTTPVSVVAGTATHRDYVEAVARAYDLEVEWEPGEVWTGQLRGDRARSWGWTPAVTLEQALGEIEPPAAG